MATARYTGTSQYQVDLTCPLCRRDVSSGSKFGFAPTHERVDTFHNCPSCLEPYIVVIRHAPGSQNVGVSVSAIYPVGKIDDTVPEEITGKIAEYYREAKRCFAVKAFKSIVTMCRGAIQSSAVQLGATKGRKLIEQIDEVAAKGVITPSLRNFAHEIRVVGNAGAHPSEEPLEDVDEEDARDIMQLAEQFFEHVYVMPTRLQKRKAARESKN